MSVAVDNGDRSREDAEREIWRVVTRMVDVMGQTWLSAAVQYAHETDAADGVDPCDEVRGTQEILRRNGLQVTSRVATAVVDGHYAYLAHGGLFVSQWNWHSYRSPKVLPGARGRAMAAVPMHRTGDRRERVISAMREVQRSPLAIHERPASWMDFGYERLYIGAEGLLVWTAGVYPYSDSEMVLGVYEKMPGFQPVRFGRRLQTRDVVIGIEEIPWLMRQWTELGLRETPPEAKVIAAVLEAQFRYLCELGIAADDSEAFEPPTAEALILAQAEFVDEDV